ncbi:hypothetical protein JR316_0007533 [Psilocybe cubensis]|uniref:Uncharacterized protein n=2 Tax=Psilocybe cubensis TaxID=181762 RepID=A0A8H8CGR9_PSICU|nr:hypothetical protein JR316_0007533 [Psilocybe cubensis]KAH9480930.1 hypothetical protein JR316_0007533 [Psilocybe cubensis]
MSTHDDHHHREGATADLVDIPVELKRQLVRIGIDVDRVVARIKAGDLPLIKEVLAHVNKLQAKVDRIRASNSVIEKEISSNKRALEDSEDEGTIQNKKRVNTAGNTGRDLNASRWANKDVEMTGKEQPAKERMVAGIRTPHKLLPGPRIVVDPTPPDASGNNTDGGHKNAKEDDHSDDEYDHRRGRWRSPLEIKTRVANREKLARSGARANMEVVGRIPDLFGVVVSPHHTPQQNNYMYGMTNVNAYVSIQTNTVYVRSTAVNAESWEHTNATSFRPSPQHTLYNLVPRGFPRNPLEVEHLVDITQNTGNARGYASWIRIEAHDLLEEFRNIALAVTPSNRDRAMSHALTYKRTAYVPDLTDKHWTHAPMPIEAKKMHGLVEDVRNETVKIPPPERLLEIEGFAKYILYYARPGSINMLVGIIMDRFLRLDRRSVFGGGLLRIIRPVDRGAHSAFTRQYVILVAHSNRYREAIARYNQENPNATFKVQRGPPFKVIRSSADEHSARNLTVDDVINVLLENGIPPEWVDHAYNFGYQYMNQKYHATAMDDDLWAEADTEQLRRIMEFGEPKGIPEWSGWRYPSEDDRIRVKLIMECEAAMKPPIISLRHTAWLQAGMEPTALYLKERPQAIVEAYRSLTASNAQHANPILHAKAQGAQGLQAADAANAALAEMTQGLNLQDQKHEMLDYGSGDDEVDDKTTDANMSAEE